MDCRVLLILFALLGTTTAMAEIPLPSDLKVSGYADGSYNIHARNYFTSGAFDRVYDLVPNGATLQQAAITFAYQPTHGFGGVLNPLMGRDAYGIASYGFNPASPFDSQTVAFVFPQAYLQYTQGRLTLMAGTFLTLIGYEQINPTQDVNFSRSVLFYNTPDTHTGIRGVYALNDKISLTAGVNNGWDNIRDWGRRKTIEFSFAYTINPRFAFSVNALNGQERATPHTDVGPLGMRTLIDLIGTFNVTDKLTLIANYDNGWQTKAALPSGLYGRAKWQGISGYMNYAFTDKWSSSLRGEIFVDSNGFKTGVRQNWRAATITVGYAPSKNAEIHAEIRRDFSNQNAFTYSNLVNTNDTGQSFALEGYYKFG